MINKDRMHWDDRKQGGGKHLVSDDNRVLAFVTENDAGYFKAYSSDYLLLGDNLGAAVFINIEAAMQWVIDNVDNLQPVAEV